MNPPAKLSDFTEALEFDIPTHIKLFDRQTGRVVSVEEEDEERPDGLPDWQKDEVEIAQAVCDDNGERFIETVEDGEAAEALWRAIKGRGAFRRFKDTADRLGLLDRWFRYRDEAMKEFVIAWAEANNVPFEDDLAGSTR